MTKKEEVQANKLGELVAERELTYANSGKTLMVKIGKPKPGTEFGVDWGCPIQIGEKMNKAYGIDSFQALIMAQQFIQLELDKLNQEVKLEWLGTEDLGFDMTKGF